MNRLENSLKWLRWVAVAIPFVMLFGFQIKKQPAQSKQPGTIRTIVIDAGHGGKDPGCHGSSSHEKNVCLSMALELGRKIKEGYPEIKVVFNINCNKRIKPTARQNQVKGALTEPCST